MNSVGSPGAPARASPRRFRSVSPAATDEAGSMQAETADRGGKRHSGGKPCWDSTASLRVDPICAGGSFQSRLLRRDQTSTANRARSTVPTRIGTDVSRGSNHSDSWLQQWPTWTESTGVSDARPLCLARPPASRSVRGSREVLPLRSAGALSMKLAGRADSNRSSEPRRASRSLPQRRSCWVAPSDPRVAAGAVPQASDTEKLIALRSYD